MTERESSRLHKNLSSEKPRRGANYWMRRHYVEEKGTKTSGPGTQERGGRYMNAFELNDKSIIMWERSSTHVLSSMTKGE